MVMFSRNGIDNAFIGLYVNGDEQFVWTDGSTTEYFNWDNGGNVKPPNSLFLGPGIFHELVIRMLAVWGVSKLLIREFLILLSIHRIKNCKLGGFTVGNATN